MAILNFFNVTANLSAGKTLTGFSLFSNSGGRTYLDDLSITTTAGAAVPEPLTLASACLAGLVGLGVAIRRRRKVATA